LGTLIRHAGLSAPIFPLAVAMIEPSFRAPLVAAVGAASLPAPGFCPANGTAIALSSVAVPADPEHHPASNTGPLTKDRLAMKIHARRQAVLDNGDRSWQVRTSFDVWLPAEGRQTGRPAASNGRATPRVPAFDDKLTPSAELLMIDG
jgi:hypothetical protein